MPRSKIELRHVRYIIAAAESGSFRRAAQDLGVEQSAISRRIRDVEDKEIDLAGRGMSAMCAYPFGFMSGMIHGTIKGVGRGISSGSKKPFSKESFSMDDPKTAPPHSN